jgi:hypothetical protein
MARFFKRARHGEQMTGARTTASVLERAATLLDPLCNVLVKDRSPKFLLIFCLAVAGIFCLCIFDPGFLLGTSSFWKNPRGLNEHGWADISTALSGYLYFARDTWQLPLFQAEKLGAPGGTNIIFTDSIPWVALAGRLVFRATGTVVNLYGLWTAFCFIASAVTMTALTARLGQRNLAAAAMATVTGLCMPALLARWGHMSMMAQFEIALALIFYLYNQRCDRPRRLFVQAALLMWLALWTHTYIFVMVGAILLATIVQAASNRTLGIKSLAGILSGLALVVGTVIALSGYLQTRGGLGAEGVGIFSMNLLSPFLPQRSGLYASFRDVIADSTGGQYEGFSYLGAGVLTLLLMSLPWQIQKLRQAWREHPWLFGLFIGFTLFALSNVVYLGPWQLVHVPLPNPIMQLASMFRATGRFFWPVMYLIAALAIVGPLAFYGRRGALLLLVALVLQLIDTAPLRQDLAARIRTPEKPHIDLAAWEAAIGRHDSIRVLPQFFCLAARRGWNSEIAVQLQLLAAFAGRPINTVYAARLNIDCKADQQIEGTPQPGTGQLSVFLDEFSGFARMQKLAAETGMCSAGQNLVVCGDVPEASPVLAKLTWTDRK